MAFPEHLKISSLSQTVKSLSAMWETRVQYLGQEDPLEEGMTTLSSSLAWRIPMGIGAWQATVHGVVKESDTFTFILSKTYTVLWLRTTQETSSFSSVNWGWCEHLLHGIAMSVW